MRRFLASTALIAAFGVGGVAHAQSAIDGRVDRLEREMRAVQRKVFPGGTGQTVEPQITAETDTRMPGAPSGSAIADMTQRVSALEEQSRVLTGQVEQGQYRLRQLEDAFAAYKRATDARIQALEPEASAAASPASGSGLGEGRPAVADVPSSSYKAPPARPAPAASERPAAAATGTRAQQVAAIEKPVSDDPAEDGYSYGYRLWSAKLYPEARRELEAVATKYPKHRRASYAQNLLGRAYLDAGAPSLAAVAFYENYKKNPNGERAPDSLFYLGEALTKLKKPATEVCKVYDQLTDVYGSKISASMQADVAAARAAQKCKP